MAKKTESPPFEVVAIDHIVLRTRRIDEVLGFYCDILGLPQERILKEIGLYQLRAGFALVDIVDVSMTKDSSGGTPVETSEADSRYDHFCLALSDINASEMGAWLQAAGIEPIGEGKLYGATGYGQSYYVKDPDGRTVELKLVEDEE
jgi:catechol 2,3-dioxygenase-like lactoylglutathione lyase family enzyme